MLNEHFFAVVTGYMTEEESERALKANQLSIYAILENHTSILLFQGIKMDNEIDYIGDTRLVKISAISSTVLLDQEMQFRTFQGRKQTYRKIIDEILKCGQHIGVIYTAGKEETNRIMVQYQESDWAFFKRLAQELGTVIVADCKNQFLCFYFGLPERKKINDVIYLNMQIRQIYDNSITTKEECITLSREYLELCDLVQVRNKSWRIIELNMNLDKGEVLFQYLMESISYKRKPSQCNNSKVKGLSIMGTVKEVENARVKVKLQSDLDVDWGDGLWYEYATVYTTPGGNGWYCMPELGEQVRLYFPDIMETHAYVISGVHRENDVSRMDPDTKSLKTKYEKEIRFTPDEIEITNNKGLSVRLNDEKGIIIKSDKGIMLHSDTALDIRSNSKVSIQAKESVSLQQNRNILLIRDGIHEKGRNIDHI